MGGGACGSGGVGKHHLQGQHDPGELPSRGALAQRQGRRAGVGDEPEGYVLDAGGPGLIESVQFNDESRPLHLQPLQLGGDSLLQVLGEQPTRPAQLIADTYQFLVGRGQSPGQTYGGVLGTVKLGQTRGGALAPGQEGIDVVDPLMESADLPAGACKLTTAVLNLGEAGRVGVQGGQVAAQLGGDVGGVDAQALGAHGQFGQGRITLGLGDQAAMRVGDE